MTDLEINIALAQAMGWVQHSHIFQFFDLPNGSFVVQQSKVLCKTEEFFPYSKSFDYRDPVIFVAICKRWKLTMVHGQPYCYCRPALRDFYANTIEKAAALCVIDAVKRGAK